MIKFDDYTYTVKVEKHNNERFYVVYVNEMPGICTDNTDLNEAMRDIEGLIQESLLIELTRLSQEMGMYE